MNKTFDTMVLFIAQGGFSGRMPVAPGTAGTVVGVLLYLLVKDLPALWYSAVFAIVTLIGTWAAGAADRVLGTKDSPTIVIDEIAGLLLAMLLVPFAWRYADGGVPPVPVLRHSETLAAQETAGYPRGAGRDAGRHRGSGVYEHCAAGGHVSCGKIVIKGER